MTQYQPTQPFQPPRPPGAAQQQYQPQPPKKQQPKWVPWIIYSAVFLAGSIVGYGSATDGSAVDATAQARPTVTVTQPAEPGATTTVPGPKTTVTVTAKPAAPVAPPAPATVMNEDGTYLVGTDVKPGTYRSSGGGSCYWARLSSVDGDFDAIIANNIGANPVVTIKKTDKAFETARCGEWKRVK